MSKPICPICDAHIPAGDGAYLDGWHHKTCLDNYFEIGYLREIAKWAHEWRMYEAHADPTHEVECQIEDNLIAAVDSAKGAGIL